MSQNQKWHLREGNKIQGPFTEEELQLLAKSGKISVDCEFASETVTKGQWKDINILPGLAELIDIDGRKFLMLKSGNYAAAKAEQPPALKANQSARFGMGNIFGSIAMTLAVLSLGIFQRPVLTIVIALFAMLFGTIGFFASTSSQGQGIKVSIAGIILGGIGLILGGILVTWNFIR